MPWQCTRRFILARYRQGAIAPCSRVGNPDPLPAPGYESRRDQRIGQPAARRTTCPALLSALEKISRASMNYLSRASRYVPKGEAAGLLDDRDCMPDDRRYRHAHHCHDLQVVGQIKQKHGFSLNCCLTKVNFI